MIKINPKDSFSKEVQDSTFQVPNKKRKSIKNQILKEKTRTLNKISIPAD